MKTGSSSATIAFLALAVLVPVLAACGADEDEPDARPDPFAGYDCGAGADQDLCESLVCEWEPSWDALVDACDSGEHDPEHCEAHLECIADYLCCVLDGCDPESGVDDHVFAGCFDDFQDCDH